MPGTNHQVESGFLEELALNHRPAAELMLRHHTLREILLFNTKEIADKLKQDFPHIKPDQWKQISRQALLTKISYFELNELFEKEELTMLAKITLYALDLPKNSLQTIYEYSEYRYPVFAQTILKLSRLLQYSP